MSFSLNQDSFIWILISALFAFVVLLFVCRAIISAFRKRKEKAELDMAARAISAEGEIIDFRKNDSEIVITLSGCDKVFVTHPVYFPILDSVEVGDLVQVNFIPPEDGGLVVDELVKFVVLKAKKVLVAEEKIKDARKVTVEGMIIDIRRNKDEILLTLSGCTEVFVAHPKQFPVLGSSKKGDVVRIEFIPPLESRRVVMADLVAFLDLTKQAEKLREELAQLEIIITDMKPHGPKPKLQIVEDEDGEELSEVDIVTT